jgi:hypothetical protein
MNIKRPGSPIDPPSQEWLPSFKAKESWQLASHQSRMARKTQIRAEIRHFDRAIEDLEKLGPGLEGQEVADLTRLKEARAKLQEYYKTV